MKKRFSPNQVTLVVIIGLALSNSCLGEEPKNHARLTLSQLSLEVAAHQTLRNLSVTEAQLKTLRQLAMQTVPRAELRREGKGTDKFRQALAELHRALTSGAEEKIDELADKLEEIRDQEKPELDDEISMTEEARRRAPEAVRLLGAGQVADYLAVLAGEIDDPRDHLIDAISKVRGLSPEKWKELQSEIAGTVGRLSAGLDAKKAERIGNEAVQLLNAVRSLGDAEFKTQKTELEKRAQKIVGDIGPFDVLRNVMEVTLAELLSNPRLPQVIDARLKPEVAKKSDPER
jgi:O6-methylguanine-DNA--protein-cysteine methyltransferase